jgi:glycosyltransferase involved in cell wall biosynthesis
VDGGLDAAVELFFLGEKAFAEAPPDILIASGPPFNVFVAGHWLARRFAARLVLDYRDEWTLSPFDFVSKTSTDRVWEKRCLERADRVLFTTESQRRMCSESVADRELLERSRVLPNGWEPAEHDARSSDQHSTGRKVTLLFAGTLGEHTNVQPFLDALEQILNDRPEWVSALAVRFLGQKRPSEVKRLALFKYPNVIESIDLAPLPEATRQMREADVLLLFHDPRFERYLPGKLYEYLASGKPILLCNDQGESKQLVESLAAGWAIDCSDTAKLAQVLAKLIDADVSDRDITARAEWLQRHTRETLTREFLKDLASL